MSDEAKPSEDEAKPPEDAARPSEDEEEDVRPARASASSPNEFQFSVGEDGIIYSNRWNSDGSSSLDVPKIEDDEESESEEEEEEEEELDEPTESELELKAEKERLLAISEAKKEVLRKELRPLKTRFRLLKQRNNDIPEAARFSKEDFFIDSRPGEVRRALDEDKLVEYYKTQEFDAAKQLVQLGKIRAFFFARVETQFIVVKDLEHENQVTTFRILTLSPNFWKLMDQNIEWIKEEALMQNTLEEIPEEVLPEVPEPVKRFYAKDLIGEFEGKTYDIGTMHDIKHLEKRLEKRYARECEWAALEAVKISSDWEAPEDIARIKHAEDTMGKYKLKEDENFPGEQLTTGQRRQKILQLKLEMYQKIHQFNKLVNLLKEEKPGLIIECRAISKELVVLQKYLPSKLRIPIPTIHDLEPSEQPEKYFDITRDDVDRRIEEKVTEHEFKQQKEAIEKKLYGPADENPIPHCLTEIPPVYKRKAHHPSLDMVLDEPQRPTQTVMKKLTSRTFTPKIQLLAQKSTGGKGQHFDGLQPSVHRFRHLFYDAKNEPDTSKRDYVLAHRKFEQQTLYNKLYNKINYFKNRMLALAGEKVHLEMNLQLMQITLMNFFEELDISKDFDIEERAVVEKLKLQRVECATVKEKVDRIKKRLDRAKADLAKVEADSAQNIKEVSLIIGDKHRFVEYLWKLFRRRVEAAPILDNDSTEILHTMTHPTAVPSATASESVTSVSSSTSAGSQETGSGTVKVPKPKMDYVRCPDGLEKEKFDKVCTLRSKQRRLDLDCETHRQIVHRINTHFEDIDRKYGKQKAKLASITDEIHALRRRKQERINDIDKIVVVKGHQIECMDDDKMDEIEGDFEQKMLNAFLSPDEVLAIPRGITNVLDARAEELKDETKIEEEKLNRARHLLRRVREELLKKEKNVTKLDETCRNDMVRKFGREVDLDQVCAAIINLELLNALARLESRRNEQFYEQHLMTKEIEEVKQQLMSVTKVNSELNTLVAILEERQRDIEYYQHLQGKDDTVVSKARDEPLYEISESREIRQKNEDVFDELDRLDEVLWMQEMKIGVLRSIISMCKTKQGIPPLIPLKTVGKGKYNNIGQKYMTYQELVQHRENKNKDVITLYKKESMMEKLERSNSEIPFHQHHHRGQSTAARDSQKPLQSVEEEETYLEEEEEEGETEAYDEAEEEETEAQIYTTAPVTEAEETDLETEEEGGAYEEKTYLAANLAYERQEQEEMGEGA